MQIIGYKKLKSTVEIATLLLASLTYYFCQSKNEQVYMGFISTSSKSLQIITFGFILYAGLLLPSLPALAAELEIKNRKDLYDMSLEELISIEIAVASTQPELLLESASSVSVITAQDIRIYGYQSVAEAISTLAGVNIANTYFQKTLPTVRGVLQDNYANKVLVMINETPTWDGTYNDNKLNRINIRDIERIEVLKGPSSVLYGTNAYAGTINIVLKNHRSDYGDINLQLSERNHHSLNYSQLMELGEESKIFWSLSSEQGARQRRDFRDENGEFDRVAEYIDNDNVTVTLTHKTHTFLFNAYDIDENYFTVVPILSRAGGALSNKGTMFSYGYKQQLASSGILNYKFVYDNTKKDYFRFEDKRESSQRESRRLYNSLSYFVEFSSDYTFELGADYNSIKNLDFSNYDQRGNFIKGHDITDRSLYSYSIWTQIGVVNKLHNWLFGLRSNENEIFGNNLSGRLSYRYDLSEKQKVRFTASQSYRSPSLFELYFVDETSGVYGNTHLAPETSDSYELSYQLVQRNWALQSTMYYATYDNKIFRKIGDTRLEDGTQVTDVNIYSNGNKFVGKGIEIEARYQTNNKWAGFITLDYIDGDAGDKAGTDGFYNFKFAPSYNISAGLNKQWKSISLAAVVTYRDGTRAPEFPIDSSTTLYINALYKKQFSSYSISHNIRINNSTNEQVNIAEYVRRRGVNEVPIVTGRSVNYQLSIRF